MLSREEAAWLAGLFDGEGCISQPRKEHRASLRLTITNTHYGLLERILEVAGVGKIIDHKAPTDRHSQTWNWQCYSDNARDLLRQMLPWLIVKREKALIAIEARPS